MTWISSLDMTYLTPNISIMVDRLGNYKVAEVGFLFGALLCKKAGRADLVERIKEFIYIRTGIDIQILIAREKLFKSDDSQDKFVWNIFFECPKNDITIVLEGLHTPYGRPSPETDHFCQMVRFLSPDLTPSCNKTSFHPKKRALDKFNVISIAGYTTWSLTLQ